MGPPVSAAFPPLNAPVTSGRDRNILPHPPGPSKDSFVCSPLRCHPNPSILPLTKSSKEIFSIHKPTDRLFYQESLRAWLPPHILDCHAHVGLPGHCGPISPERRKAIWAIEVGLSQPWEELRANYQLLFPEQRVSALVFGGVYREIDIERNNAYVLAGLSSPENDAHALLVTRPERPASTIAEAMQQGFLGIKPYPDLAPQGMEQAGIFDFVPRSHLQVLNELKGVLVLHLPRPGRIGDPDNVRELLELSDTYPSVRLIVAHIGRAYCLPTAQRGLPHLADRPSIYFDTAANLNADVFHYALETVGPDRLLFGSDLPVTMMRGVREHVGETYLNYTDAPYSWNVSRKTPEEEARYTYFLYEELRALISALQRAGLGREAMRKIMFLNTAGLLGITSHDT